jgi:NitT/TauT family transport system ATP-binding protein
LRIVAGLEAATAGEVRIDGSPALKPGIDRGFVFQTDNLLPWRNVLANAMIGPEVAGAAGPEARSRTLDLLKLVGLAGFEHYFPRQLSGGMRQRVNLARALAVEPAVLLMDEPFASLDAQTRELMQAELLRIWSGSGRTVLFITHQVDEALYLGDRVVAMKPHPGRIAQTYDVALPRPRDRRRTPEHPEFLRLRRELYDFIEADHP